MWVAIATVGDDRPELLGSCDSDGLVRVALVREEMLASTTDFASIGITHYCGDVMEVLHRPSLPNTEVCEAGPYARAMTLPVAPVIATEISLVYHIILEALGCGQGNEHHLASMSQMTIKTVLIGKRCRVTLSDHVFDNARQGIITCRRVGLRTGSWRLGSLGYKALCKVLVAFDRQLEVTPFYEFMLVNEDLNELLARRKTTK